MFHNTFFAWGFALIVGFGAAIGVTVLASWAFMWWDRRHLIPGVEVEDWQTFSQALAWEGLQVTCPVCGSGPGVPCVRLPGEWDTDTGGYDAADMHRASRTAKSLKDR